MDYKNYSFENLENWLHDALSCGEASPHEIYSVIRKVVKDEYDYHKEKSQQCFGLLELMSGHRPVDFEVDDDVDRTREYNLREAEYYNKRAELDAITREVREAGGYEWTPEVSKKKWILPVEQVHDDYFVSFPDDLLKAAKLREGDEVIWVDNGDGSYTLRKVSKSVREESNDFWEQSYLSGVTDTLEEANELRSEIEAIRAAGGYEWTPKT